MCLNFSLDLVNRGTWHTFHNVISQNVLGPPAVIWIVLEKLRYSWRQILTFLQKKKLKTRLDRF